MLIFERLDTTDSTQREVLRRLSGGPHIPNGVASDWDSPAIAQTPFGLWTTQQTQGMASHGRRWHDSSAGGLALSIAWPQESGQLIVSAWPVRWSLLVMTTLEEIYPELANRLGVKWPNDVMANNAKLAGILVSRHSIGGRWWCVAGVGINLFWKEIPDLGRPVTDLQTLGVTAANPEKIVASIAAATSSLLQPMGASASLGWCEAYRRRDIVADAIVQVVHPITGDVLACGANRGITANGELLLEIDGQLQSIAVGELSLRYAQDPHVATT